MSFRGWIHGFGRLENFIDRCVFRGPSLPSPPSIVLQVLKIIHNANVDFYFTYFFSNRWCMVTAVFSFGKKERLIESLLTD